MAGDMEHDLGTVLAFGNSHLRAIADGAQGAPLPFKLKLAPFWDTARYGDDAVRWTGTHIAYADALSSDIIGTSRQLGTAGIIAFVSSQKYFELSIINPTLPFDFVYPDYSEVPLEDGKQVIPYDLIHALLKREHETVFGLVPQVREAYSGPFFVPCMPPPAASLEAVLKHAPAQWLSRLEERGAPSDVLRLKLWMASAKALRDICRSLGLTYLSPPAASLDGHYLAADFLSDGFHGNAEYGRLVLSQVQDALAHHAPRLQ